MRFTETPLKGAYLIDLEKREDERGFFARLYCEKEFEQHGLATKFVQINDSLNSQRGTLRGLHYQLPPSGEAKIVRCLRGSFFDVIVDIRPKSSTFLKFFGYELTAENRTMMYVPVGFAHGFLTTSDDAEVLYILSSFYAPEQQRGLRYDDPTISIQWPFDPVIVSRRDTQHPDFSAEYHLNTELKELNV
jgi:dTDP-4-dehydrorhamnose 3,5-epimerase